MADRKEEILNIIVEEYIKTANPVGSTLIVEKYLTDLSSATVRNDMADLEEMGLIFQPHTSAGRIPTIDGYKKYLEIVNIKEWENFSNKTKEAVADIEKAQDEQDMKNLAKALAELSDSAILIGFSPMNVYYTGISNIFKQPEFREQSVVFSISEIIDHLDDVMNAIFSSVDNNLQILLGEENPFGAFTSVILTKCEMDGRDILVGMLGPNRMDYKENIGLLRHVQKKLSKNK